MGSAEMGLKQLTDILCNYTPCQLQPHHGKYNPRQLIATMADLFHLLLRHVVHAILDVIADAHGEQLRLHAGIRHSENKTK